MDYLFAIEEEQSLTRASKRLFIAQSTLSMYLNRLESELGVKLFDRTKSPVLPTPAGRIYLEELKRIQKIEKNLLRTMDQIAHPQKTLAIGIGPARSGNWMPVVLPIFREFYPDVAVHIIEQGDETLIQGLRNGKFDVALGTMPYGPEEEAVELALEQVCLIAPRSFNLVPQWLVSSNSALTPYELSAEQLNERPVILPDGVNDLNAYSRQMLDHYHIQSGPIISASSMSTAAGLVAAGLGYLFTSPAFLPVNDSFLKTHIVFCTLRDLPATRKLVACFPHDSVKKEMIQKLLSVIREQVLDKQSFFSPIK